MKQADFGSWHSPISAQAMVANNVGLIEVRLHDGVLYHLESRPQEGGRCVLVQHAGSGELLDVNPAPFNIRSRVHEYGGNAFVFTDNAVVYSDFSSQQLFIQPVDFEQGEFAVPQALTTVEGLRFADAIFDAKHNRLFCVCEDHRIAGQEAINTIATVELSTGEVNTLVAGNDFYAAPQLNDVGTCLAWVQWQHPNMPWDSTQLCQASIDDAGALSPQTQLVIAGGSDISVVQPQWLDSNKLIYASDESGWWNLYVSDAGNTKVLVGQNAEYASPLWGLGTRNYCIQGDSIVASYHGPNNSGVCRINPASGSVQELNLDCQLKQLCANDQKLCAIATMSAQSSAVVTLADDALTTTYASAQEVFGEQYYSIAESISFQNKHGQECYAYYYPPQNPDYQAPQGQLPPLITQLHGGPTSAASNGLSMAVQFWTSRGFAVVDVNYGGSSGFGREYRNRLLGQWGVVDVDDTVAAVEYLIEQGLVNPKQCAIRGGSAGGYTTLAALAFNDTFSAGASYYGIGDIEALAADTHKFESRYCDNLIGPYPEAKAIYQQRSPINSLSGFNCPVIFFQGAEDKVVPPNQAEMMVEALDKQKIPVAYVLFANEQHGFRRSENIIRAYNAEWLFYARVFGFVLSDELPAIEIKHLG